MNEAHALGLTKLLYDNRKAQILSEQQESDDSTFVATYCVYLDSNSNAFSTCVWTKGVETLLPQAQFVTFVDLEEEILLPFVPFQDVVEACGLKVHHRSSAPIYYLAPAESYPSKGRVDSWCNASKREVAKRLSSKKSQ
jgi:hypothetical protein